MVKFSATHPYMTVATGDEELGPLKFENGVLSLDENDELDAKRIAHLRKHIKISPALSQVCKEIDYDRGVAVAEQFKREVANRNKGIGGTLSAGQIRAATADVLADRARDEMINFGNDPDAAAKISAEIAAADKLGVTEKGDGVVVRNTELKTAGEIRPLDPAIADARANPPQPSVAAKSRFAALQQKK